MLCSCIAGSFATQGPQPASGVSHWRCRHTAIKSTPPCRSVLPVPVQRSAASNARPRHGQHYLTREIRHSGNGTSSMLSCMMGVCRRTVHDTRLCWPSAVCCCTARTATALLSHPAAETKCYLHIAIPLEHCCQILPAVTSPAPMLQAAGYASRGRLNHLYQPHQVRMELCIQSMVRAIAWLGFPRFQ